MTTELEKRVEEFKSKMTALQRRIYEETGKETQKRQEQQKRLQAGFLAGKSWKEMQEEKEDKEIDGHVQTLLNLTLEQDQWKLKFREMMKGVCYEGMFDDSQEWWHWLAIYEGFKKGLKDNRDSEVQQMRTDMSQPIDLKEKPEQQKEEQRERQEDEEPLVIYLGGGGVRTIEKEQGKGKGQHAKGKGR